MTVARDSRWRRWGGVAAGWLLAVACSESVQSGAAAHSTTSAASSALPPNGTPGSATASTSLSFSAAAIASQVAQLQAQAGGVARGPEAPVEDSQSLVTACTQGGRTYVDGAGACAAGGGRGADAQFDVRTTPPIEALPRCAEGPPLGGPSGQPVAELVAFTVNTIDRVTATGVSYETTVTGLAADCSARLTFISQIGVPKFASGEELSFRQDRWEANDVAVGYTEVLDKQQRVAWVRYMGRAGLHAEHGPPGLELEFQPDEDPTCYLTFNSAQHPAFGMTFKTKDGSCHVEPQSSNCCRLWGEDYVVQMDEFYPTEFYPEVQLNYVIARARIMVEPETLASPD